MLYKVDEIFLRGRIMRVFFKSEPTIMVRRIKISLEQQKVCTLTCDTKREENGSILNIYLIFFLQRCYFEQKGNKKY